MAKPQKQAPVTPEQLRDAALKSVFEVLSGKKETDEAATLAMKYLNYESRTMAIQHGRSKLAFAMVRVLSDPELVRKYVVSTEPVVKKLVG